MTGARMGREFDAAAPYLAQYAAAKPGLPGCGVPWLARLRDEAIARFADLGFPTPRVEAWKYTDLTRLARTPFGEAGRTGGTAAGLPPGLLDRGETHRLALIDGRFAPHLSDLGTMPEGARLTSLAALADSDPAGLEAAFGRVDDADGAGLAALNTALMRDGAVLLLDRGTTIDKPVHLVNFVTSEKGAIAVHPRHSIVAGEGSRATVIETYAGNGRGRYWTNAVTRVAAGAGSALRYVKLQDEAAAAYHTGLLWIEQDRDSSVTGFVASVGAATARSEIRAAIVGEGASCRLDGGVLARGRQHGDITTEIDHRVPHGASRQTFKNVLDDRGRSVFQGRIVVRAGACKADARQSNRNLLLSPRARAEAKPELRILADDVKCSHGATVGELDRDALFYLESRGIDAAEARALLIEAFLGELIEAAPEGMARRRLRARIAAWVGTGHTLELAA